MRVATLISLLLFACAACGLQLHHECRDGSVIQRRSIQRIPRRRLASRIIESSILGPDIVPRCQAQITLSELKAKKQDVKPEDVFKTIFFGHYKVYRVHFGAESVVVKEIDLSVVNNWNEREVQEEVRGAARVKKLVDAFFDGHHTYFILTEDLGNVWGVGQTQAAIERGLKSMEEADKWYEKVFHMKRVVPNSSTGYHDYAWTRHGGDSQTAEPVGRWRFWRYTKETPDVQKYIHYSGIKEWKDGLPVFAT
ncbi:hypothetical protein APHAL10511_000549 [Amanita phalloides]|nr:hypothetical protein APHAL10511_000549 [Amanita phalloides]